MKYPLGLDECKRLPTEGHRSLNVNTVSGLENHLNIDLTSSEKNLFGLCKPCYSLVTKNETTNMKVITKANDLNEF